MHYNLFIITIVVVFFVNTCNCSKIPEGYFFEQNLTSDEIKGQKLTPEILWKFGRVLEVKLSPDGSEIAYIVKYFDVTKNIGNSEIFIMSSDGGEPKQLTYTLESESSINWSPDGKRIGFISSKSGNQQIYEIEKNGKNFRQISFVEGDIESFAYSPKGNKILFTKRVKTDSSAQDKNPDLPLSTGRVYTDLMYRHWDTWWDYKNSHVFIADITESGLKNIKDINEGEPYNTPLAPFYDSKEITWSPDGKYVAYTSRKLKGKAESLSTNSDIYLYDVESSTTVNLSEGMPGYDRYPVFSPDGSKICWQSMATPGYESDKDRLMLYDFNTKTIKDLTTNFDESVSNIVWDESNKSLYFISGLNATYQVFKLDIPTSKIKQITNGWHDYTYIEKKGKNLIGVKMSMQYAKEIFKIDDEGNQTQLSFINEPIYKHIPMGKVQCRWISTTDNKKMLVWVILPPDFDSTKIYPALLYCQGGPQSAVSQFFSYRWNFQLMAANGYIIIAPNRRGLPTFGKEWNDQIALDYGGQNIKDYLSAIDALKNEPYIDENRLGAIGASYGGFSVFYLAGHHNKRFKTFIAHCGIFNFESQFASTEEYFFEYHDIGGAFWDKPKPKSYNFSPHLYVENWDTPIMIISGEKDFRIPYTESLQAFNVAQLRNIPSKLLIFPDEGHWILKPQNSILWQREFFDWLDKWLK